MMAEDVATITTDESKRVTNEDLLAAIRGLDGDADRDRLPSEARMNVNPGTNRHDILTVVMEYGPISGDEVNERIGKSSNSVLSRLHYGFLIDRTDDGKYKINHLGRDALNHGNQTLDDIDTDDTEESDNPDPNPWDGTPITCPLYEALQAVEKSAGHPTSEDAVEHYSPDGYAESQSACSASLYKLYQRGFLDRTPSKPYHYWLTDDGEELLK